MSTQLTTEQAPQKGPSSPEPHLAAGKLPSYLPWAIVGGAAVLAAVLTVAFGLSPAADFTIE